MKHLLNNLFKNIANIYAEDNHKIKRHSELKKDNWNYLLQLTSL